jgi:glutamyl-tRNA reductase
MIVRVIGSSFHNTPVGLRERLALDGDKLARALDELNVRHGCEAVIVSTCNRVETYVARADSAVAPDAALIATILGEVNGLPATEVCPHLYEHTGPAAVGHLFRVASSLDSLVVGEGQIVRQIREAYEAARTRQCVGPLLNALFQHALRTAKRVRAETGIAHGRMSVSTAAVDYVRQVFSHFGDKTVLVIGAGKMAELTLRHLRELHPQQILVTNRRPDKAHSLATRCGGRTVPWELLDNALREADIVLSTTGAPEPIVTLSRFEKAMTGRCKDSIVILDIAVPRDFDPRIHDGERTCLVNIDDLSRFRERTLAERRKHVGAAEALVAEQTRTFFKDWSRRRNGPVIERLTQEFDAKRQAVVCRLFAKLSPQVTEADRKYIEGALRLFESRILHGPINALAEEANHGRSVADGQNLLAALRRLFRLPDCPIGEYIRRNPDPASVKAAA